MRLPSGSSPDLEKRGGMHGLRSAARPCRTAMPSPWKRLPCLHDGRFRWSVPEIAFGEELVRPNCELGAVLHAELLEDRVEINLHRSFGDSELLRDFPVAQSAAHEADQLTLARRERQLIRFV